MASRSPQAEPQTPAQKSDREAYLLGWAALTLSMNRGVSWSGHERNVAFLNLGDGTFADASAVTGLDHEDDGRGVAVVDWDGDGDLDVWLRNRTGPQLRFHRNDAANASWCTLVLEGRTCNRDAVGARVVLQAGKRSHVRHVISGDGYLSQSSLALHFGLGNAEKIERLVVHWPGGTAETFGPPKVRGRYRLVQGSGVAKALAPRSVVLKAGALPVPPAPSSTRVLLREPLYNAISLSQLINTPGKPRRTTILNLWSHTCPPCVQELTQWAVHKQTFAKAEVNVFALCMDPPDEQATAQKLYRERIASVVGAGAIRQRPASDEHRRLLKVLLQHVLAAPDEVAFPASLLIGRDGRIQMVYLGPVEPEQIVLDAGLYASDTPFPANRRGLFAGRWYFRTPRDLRGLARNLNAEGLRRDASWYLHVLRRTRPRKPR